MTLYGEETLESRSQLAILNGHNLAAIGDEMLQFKTATLVEPNKYILSGLLRGRLGTEWATAGHSAAEDFVLIDNRLIKEAMPNALIGLQRLYKGVSIGDSLASTTSQSFTYQANSLKPYAPVHVLGVRDGSGNLTITWVRRTRINGQWTDYVDVPLGENAEAYEVDVMDGSTVVRTITASSQSVSYTAAQQTTDFGSSQSVVTVRVFQVSSAVGRGEKGEGQI